MGKCRACVSGAEGRAGGAAAGCAASAQRTKTPGDADLTAARRSPCTGSAQRGAHARRRSGAAREVRAGCAHGLPRPSRLRRAAMADLGGAAASYEPVTWPSDGYQCSPFLGGALGLVANLQQLSPTNSPFDAAMCAWAGGDDVGGAPPPSPPPPPARRRPPAAARPPPPRRCRRLAEAAPRPALAQR